MYLEIGICAFLVGSLVLVIARGLQVLSQLRKQLLRQKAFTVQEADVWITCALKAQALDAPKYRPTADVPISGGALATKEGPHGLGT